MVNGFVPVLLGTEIGAYGIARAFWEAYGARSRAYGTFPLTPTAHSRFIDVSTDAGFLDADRFVEVLNAAVPTLAGARGLVIPCGDDYSLLLAANAHRLDAAYAPVCSTSATLAALNDKSSFYGLCAHAGVPCPACVTVADATVPDLPFPFPVAVKPTDAAAYREHAFAGQKKAFVLDDPASLAETLRRVYASGYAGRMVIQDFVPGDDSAMRVVNGYVDAAGTLTLASVGQPVLEDCAPMRIGNYAAIVALAGDDTAVIYEQVERLMGHVEYHGYFNIDLKRDERDGSFQFLDFNPRMGRSSFFTTLSGCNLARCAVEDLAGEAGPPRRGGEEVLWTGVPRRLVRRFAPDGPAKDRALALMRAGRVGTTLFGAHDNDPRRLWAMAKLWVHYYVDFRRYFGKRDLSE